MTADTSTTLHTHSMLRMARVPRWHAGQTSFHPDTVVLCGIAPMPARDVAQWAMQPCTWRGKAYWYGWSIIRMVGGREIVGWMLTPRDPLELPSRSAAR